MEGNKDDELCSIIENCFNDLASAKKKISEVENKLNNVEVLMGWV